MMVPCRHKIRRRKEKVSTIRRLGIVPNLRESGSDEVTFTGRFALPFEQFDFAVTDVTNYGEVWWLPTYCPCIPLNINLTSPLAAVPLKEKPAYKRQKGKAIAIDQ